MVIGTGSVIGTGTVFGSGTVIGTETVSNGNGMGTVWELNGNETVLRDF